MKASLIIVAAGAGTRLGSNGPKAFVKVGGRSLIAWTLGVVAAAGSIEEAVIAVPAGFEAPARGAVRAAGLEIPVKIVPGGAERQDSVRIALELTSIEAEIVAIHDAARPFAPPGLFEDCIAAAALHGGAIAAIPVVDTLKRAASGIIGATIPRAGIWHAQTPQAFRRSLLVAGHLRASEAQVTVTDDADLVEREGGKVAIVESSARNLKITTPSDLEIAEAIAAAGSKRRAARRGTP
ncbi:MAG TPA: 2-C-methyl-D-erythritol 4-phosphate cytidylyltransferase [Candidatus Binataceae bacterium]|nr:2-C-methyl-D-erythritol 4-phosphate cytidylyltransferase [Candidatus Binataceae bacterium]